MQLLLLEFGESQSCGAGVNYLQPKLTLLWSFRRSLMWSGHPMPRMGLVDPNSPPTSENRARAHLSFCIDVFDTIDFSGTTTRHHEQEYGVTTPLDFRCGYGQPLNFANCSSISHNSSAPLPFLILYSSVHLLSESRTPLPLRAISSTLELSRTGCGGCAGHLWTRRRARFQAPVHTAFGSGSIQAEDHTRRSIAHLCAVPHGSQVGAGL